MNLEKARNILERSAKGAISYVESKGYRWYVDYFLPAIRKIESQHRTTCRDSYLISEAHYINGDVHDFNDAPQAAIRAYRRCLKWDPKAGGAWREMGMGAMYDDLGYSKEECSKHNGILSWVRSTIHANRLTPINRPSIFAGTAC